MPKLQFAKKDYTVGWVCALFQEMTAATCMLDETHQDIKEQDAFDFNSYQLGRIGQHYIVIACLPAGVYGTSSATAVAKDMLRTFPSIRIGLMVGIGGAAPSSKHDIRLGDVVVSKPTGQTGGVIQFDRGRVTQGGKFQPTGSLNSPPEILLKALNRLQSEHEVRSNYIPQFLSKMYEEYPKTSTTYAFPGSPHDHLYQAAYEHPETDETCEMCDPHEQVRRKPRKDTSPQIHYGNIASSNVVMKDGVTRDELRKELDVLCFEMEAAGLMQGFPCLVIRGICDYSDSHKNKSWQRYAAATAAGFAKELLGAIKEDVRKEKEVSDSSQEHEKREELRRQRECHQAFKTSTYEQFKNNNPDRVANTCRWVLENDKYAQWWQGQKDDLLWISADPGCGKSVLARSLIDHELRTTSTHTTCYFFFKDNEEQDSLATALCAVLHQLFSAQPQLLQCALKPWNDNGQKLQTEVYELWRILLTAVAFKDTPRVTVVMDALDECRSKDRQTLMELLHDFYGRSSWLGSRSSFLKFLVTSRPYKEVEDGFQWIGSKLPTIRLHGELENDRIHEEIDFVIRQRVDSLAVKNGLSPNTTKKLKRRLLDMENRTYLWLHLAMDDIENTFEKSFRPDSESIRSLLLPRSVEDAYEKILMKVSKNHKRQVVHILHIIVGARRPLTTSEMAMALGIILRRGAQSFVEFKISEDRMRKIVCGLCGLFVFINHSKIYLIHQTAKEFLVQRGIKQVADLWRHSLDPGESEAMMARICVEYLSLSEIYEIASPKGSKSRHAPTHQRQSKMGEEREIEVLLSYSSEHWGAHFRNASFELEDAVVSKARELCRVKGNQFRLWFPFLWQASRPYLWEPDFNDLIVGAFIGDEMILRIILATESIDLESPDQHGQTALIWAAEIGHEKVVEVLLDEGAKVVVEFGSALEVASIFGHEKVVKVLLDRGAEVNARYNDGIPLQLASVYGHEKIVTMLLKRGANVNAKCGDLYGPALAGASIAGYEKIAKMLLDQGAEVNAQGGKFGNALQAASLGGREKIVKMLLDQGAEVNAQGGKFGNALQAASFGGHEKIVEMLLDQGAEVNARGGKFDNALQAASAGTTWEKEGVNAKQTASPQNHEKTVRMLLNNGAQVNAQGGFFMNALQAALEGNQRSIVEVLYNAGAKAKVNAKAQVEYHDIAIRATSSRGHKKQQK